MKKPASFQPAAARPTAAGQPAAKGPPTAEGAGSVTSPIDSLLADLQSALGVRRRDALGRIRNLESALAAYHRAVEERVVLEFARDHQLRAPKLVGLTPEAAAQNLLDAVLALPELATTTSAGMRGSPPGKSPADSSGAATGSVPTGSVPTGAALPDARAPRPGGVEGPPADEPLPRLAAQGARKIVVIGALAGRQRSEAIPAGLLAQTEWVDTESGGAHAIGNLPQRIRQGRVAALVILDRAVQHKHTEPLVSAARAVGVPVGFAGKGGAASIRREHRGAARRAAHLLKRKRAVWRPCQGRTRGRNGWPTNGM